MIQTFMVGLWFVTSKKQSMLTDNTKGTNKVRQKLRAHGKNINTNQLVREWHEKRNANPTASLITVSQVVSQPLYNRLEGVSTARQLTETVDEFLKRLPPRSTISGSWIWITCPAKGKKVDTHRAPELQDSPDDDMIDRACALLSQFDSEKEQIATSNPNAVQSTITRKLGPLREQLKQDILDLAVRNGVTCGKVHNVFFGMPRLVCTNTLTCPLTIVDALPQTRRCKQNMAYRSRSSRPRQTRRYSQSRALLNRWYYSPKAIQPSHLRLHQGFFRPR
jgi:hypothetical protein